MRKFNALVLSFMMIASYSLVSCSKDDININLENSNTINSGNYCCPIKLKTA